MTAPLSALIAMSAFKSRLSNREACEVIASALKEKNILSQPFPMGDGGAGSLWTVQAAIGGELFHTLVSDPLGRKVEAQFLTLPNAQNPSAIYLESAEACGYQRLQETERDAMRASSLGLGELILFALQRWENSLKRIYVGLGDSAVSDMGMGMLSALGFSFLDDSGKNLWPNANSLRQVKSFLSPKTTLLGKVKFTVLCDVLNPVCGPSGSARIFAPQKGATPTQVNLIEQGMENLAAILQKATGRNLRAEPMTGSAGGLAAAFLGFLNAELVLGTRFLMEWAHFDQALQNHAFLIVGEGKTDKQTLSGKAPAECIARAKKIGKKVVVISGVLGEGHDELLKRGLVAGCFACGESPSAKEALYRRVTEVFSDSDFVKSLTQCISPPH